MSTILFYIPSRRYLSYLADIRLPDEAELVVLTEISMEVPPGLRGKCRVIETSGVFDSDTLNAVVRRGIEALHRWALEEHQSTSKSLVARWVKQNASLWWVSGYLYFYNEFLHVVKSIELLQRVIHANKVDGIISVNSGISVNLASEFIRKDDRFYFEIFRQLADKWELDFISLPPHRKDICQARVNKVIDQVKVFLLKYLFEPLSKLLRRTSADVPSLIDGLVVSPSPNFGRIYDLDSGEEQFGDSKLGYLFQFLKINSEWKLAGIDANSIPDLNRSILQKRVKLDHGIPWMPVEKFIKMKDFFRTKSEFNCLKLSSDEVKNYMDKLEYNGIQVGKILMPRFKLINDAFLFSGILKLKAFTNVLDQLRPQFVMLTYETGLHGRAACAAAHALDIPVLGIQHGKIHPAHPQYVIPGCSTLAHPTALMPPTVDKLAVFGKATERVLVENNGYYRFIPEVTGQVASDSLAYANKIYRKKRFYQENGIENDSGLILILSQNLETGEEYQYFYKTVLSEADTLSLSIAIKLHPREKMEIIRDIIDSIKPGTLQVHMFQKQDLYELIWYADIVATGNSTTGMDALSLGKPLITVEGFKYGMGYAEAGASIGVRSSSEFVVAVQRLLEDETLRKNLKNRGEMFLSQFRLKPDGQASARVYGVLKNLVEQTLNENSSNI